MKVLAMGNASTFNSHRKYLHFFSHFSGVTMKKV